MVEFLIARGAPTNLPDEEPWATPLAWADRRGHSQIASILSPLMTACCAIPTRRIQIDGVTAKNVIALLYRRRILFRRVSVDDSLHYFGSALRALRRSEGLADTETIVQAQ